jgi:single-stranded-DNA-specific exonuclease
MAGRAAAAHAYVVAGESWHEGVIGIVASRLVERFNRPVVLIAGTEGDWKGSGRSIPSFDLHGALGACSTLLERWGGHRAAAGLSIKPENVSAFAAAFAAYAAGLLVEDDLRPVTQVDAVVPRGTRLTLDLCTELARLAPFGLGNPDITLLAPGCELGELATVGEGKHLRFRVRCDGSDAGSAIAFGAGTAPTLPADGRWMSRSAQENRWNGTVAPQLVAQDLCRRAFRPVARLARRQYRKLAEARDADAVTPSLSSRSTKPARRRHLLSPSSVPCSRARCRCARARL